MLRAYKYRIYPTAEQRKMIDQTIGVCRLIYNLALECKIRAYQSAGIRLSAYDLSKEIKELRAEYSWIAEVNSQAIGQSINSVDMAFDNFFNGSGFPKFKKKRNGGSFRCHNNARRIDWDKSTLTIPKIKDIPIVLSREFNGKIKTVTVSKTPTEKYFASILVDDGQEMKPAKQIIESSAIGIDVGLNHFAVLSNGAKIDNPRTLRNNLARLKCLQRRLSRKKKGSKNRNKARIKMALQYEKVVNQRNDFLHKLSSAITKQYDTVCVENLSVRSMVKNPNMALSISDAGWGEFFRQLEYKQKWSGGNYLELPKFEPSTKPCNKCGTLNKTLTLADREWVCAKCGELHDRDRNAAINIKQHFFKKYSPEDSREEPVESLVIAGATKQEISST